MVWSFSKTLNSELHLTNVDDFGVGLQSSAKWLAYCAKHHLCFAIHLGYFATQLEYFAIALATAPTVE